MLHVQHLSHFLYFFLVLIQFPREIQTFLRLLVPPEIPKHFLNFFARYDRLHMRPDRLTLNLERFAKSHQRFFVFAFGFQSSSKPQIRARGELMVSKETIEDPNRFLTILHGLLHFAKGFVGASKLVI